MSRRHCILAGLGLIVAVLAGLPAATPGGADERSAAAPAPARGPDAGWGFEGPFGRYDKAALRRGFRVYLEACNACHGLRHVAYRDLAALGDGFDADTIKALATQTQILDGPDANGEMVWRPARPADRITSAFPTPEAARQANNGLLPVDLSLIVKAHKGGLDGVYAFLVGYDDAVPDVTLAPGMFANRAAPGGQTAMPPPLFADMIDYADGTAATVPQMAADVTQFLAWAADPHMEKRKHLGLYVVSFLALLTLLFVALKREIWSHIGAAKGSGETDQSGTG